MKKINSFLDQLRRIKYNYLVASKNSKSECNYMAKLQRYKVRWNPNNKNVVLTQIIQDYGFAIKLAAASNYLAKRKSSNIGLFSIATQVEDHVYQNKFWWDKVYSEILYKRLDRIFLSFGGKVVFRNVYQYKHKHKIDQEFNKVKGQIKHKEDIIGIEFNGVKVGDLIYDTYLRFAQRPTVDLSDAFLDKIILQALHIYYNLVSLFQKYNVTGLVTSYTTYLQHGLIARFCLSRNIPVYGIATYKAIVHQAIAEYPSAQNNHQYFARIFNHLDKKQERILLAKKYFESRFAGNLDSAISYMRSSAYSDSHNAELEKFDGKKTVLILAHCFFDSPHIYRDLLFVDFYEWITFTLDILSQNRDIHVLVKEHPNGIAGNDLVIDDLKSRYFNTNVTFIDKKTSNKQLFKLKPRLMITAYGTAAAEFAYQQIPVLSIYDNPFIAYDFIHVARSVQEYKNALIDLNSINPIQDIEQIAESYYMQNLFFLQGLDSNYLDFFKYHGLTFSDSFLDDYTPSMTEEYFNILDSSIKTGFELCEWEQKIIE